MIEFKRGDIIKRKNVERLITIPLPKGLVTEVLDIINDKTLEENQIIVLLRNNEGEETRRYAKYFNKASKREAFLYYILGPYISGEE